MTGRSSAARKPTAATTTGTAAPRATPRTAPRATPRTPGRTTPAKPDLRLVPGVPAARPHRRVTAGLGSGRAPFVLLVVALLACTTLGLLILNTAIAVDSLKATELRAANAERAEEVQRLEQQVVAANAPAQIAGAAAAAGLVPAGPAAFLVIAADGSSTLRGTPLPADATPVETPTAGTSPAAGRAPAPDPATDAAGTAGGG